MGEHEPYLDFAKSKNGFGSGDEVNITPMATAGKALCTVPLSILRGTAGRLNPLRPFKPREIIEPVIKYVSQATS